MARKTTAQRFREFDDLVLAVSGRPLRSWIDDGWQKLRESSVGGAADSLSRAGMAMDPYQVLGLSSDATEEQVKTRKAQLSHIYHPDRPGGDLKAMKLVNNAADDILTKLKRQG